MNDLSRELSWLLKEKYSGNMTPAFERDSARIISGEPVDYVIGWKDILGCRVYLNHHPLIPRIETEHWVEQLVARRRHTPPKTLLDMFTGSGVIGLGLLRVFPTLDATFSDINSSALEQVRENLAKNALHGRVTHSDMFERIEGTYDLITANPPYIPHGSTDLASSVREYEPHDALYADEEGLDFIRELLENAERYLDPKGLLIIEFDDPEQSSVERIAKENGWKTEFLKDQFGLWRLVYCTK